MPTAQQDRRTRRARTAVVGAAVAGLLVGLLAGLTPAEAAGRPAAGRTTSQTGTQSATPIGAALTAAADRYAVPRDLLVAIGWSQTHLTGRKGARSGDDGYGVMDLSAGDGSLARAATLTGRPVSALKTDDAANIAGAAALLSDDARRLHLRAVDRPDLAAWYAVVEQFSGARSSAAAQAYASEVYQTLVDGVRATTGAGEPVRLAGHRGLATAPRHTSRGPQPLAVAPDTGAGPDCSTCGYYPASTNNYSVADRPVDGNRIRYIVIHDTEGSWASAIDYFQNPAADVSAHFVVSRSGYIGESVRPKNIAYHAGNWDYNVHAIGVEHEGFAYQPGWYTTAEYQASARLVRALAITYGVPMDRQHIIGHYQVPNQANGHTDPGPYWNWDYYMSLVRQGATPQQIRGIRPDVTTDFTGDGAADISLYRPATGQWVVRGQHTVAYGGRGYLPVPAHWVSPGYATKAVYRRSTGQWFFHNHSSLTFGGRAGDVPVPADYYGTGYAKVAIFRPGSGRWYFRHGSSVQWGRRGDIPVPADYNHDGKVDVAVYRPSTGQWFVRGQPTVTYGGQRGDVPIAADFTGWGYARRSIWRPSTQTWYLSGRKPFVTTGRHGIPVAADWDADGIAERMVYEPATGAWQQNGGYVGTVLGLPGDLPLPAARRHASPVSQG